MGLLLRASMDGGRAVWGRWRGCGCGQGRAANWRHWFGPLIAVMAWVVSCLAWLAGVAWQLSEAALWPLGVYVAGGAAALVLLLSWCWCVRAARGGCLCARQTALRWALGLSGMAMLAWASTGWRASMQMAQQVPQAWLKHDVMVDVQVEGLPRPVTGGVLFDARVLNWPNQGLPNDGVAAGCCLPRRLSLRMNTPDGLLPRAGERWRLQVRLHPPDGLSNPGGFDATLPFFERGVRAVGQVRDRGVAPWRLSDRPEHPWQGLIDRQRQRIRADIQARISDPRAAGVLAGLSVGDQSAIDRDDWDVFRRTGVAHLVSISGAHIAMFGWLASWLIRRLWARWPAGVHRMPAPELARWGAVAASALYALLAGWGIPAQRTVWMMLVMTFLRSGGRRWPWPLVWLASAVVVTALDPWALWQPGFWLSYVAVAVLMSSGMPMQEALASVDAPDQTPSQSGPVARLAKWVLDEGQGMGRTQWRITMALTPLALVCFQQVSIVSFAANMVAIPLFTLGITPLALLGAVWAPLWDAGAWLIQLAMALLGGMSSRTWAVVQAPALPGWVAAGAVVAGLALALPARWRWRLAALPFLLPVLYLPQGWHLLAPPRPGEFQIVALDIGQGTSVLVRTAHHQLLFDTGPRIGTHNDAGSRTVLPLLRALGIRQLDALVISHEDNDHVGGAAAIVDGLPVGRLISSLDEAHPLRAQLGHAGAPLVHQACTAGQHWVWEGVRFDILHPTDEDYAQRQGHPPNALSCVLRVSRLKAPAQQTALIAGDIEAAQEAAMLARADAATPGQSGSTLHSTLLVAPHHGSKTSSTRAFLQAVRPEQVLIQVGRRNRYGHPEPSVLARYEALGLAWQATPACGAYIWDSDQPPVPSTDGQQPKIGQCWRQGHRRQWDVF